MDRDWRRLAEVYKEAYTFLLDVAGELSGDVDDLMFPCEECLCLHGRFSYPKKSPTLCCSICNEVKCSISFNYILAKKGNWNGMYEIKRSNDCCTQCKEKLDQICSKCIINVDLEGFTTCNQGCCFLCPHINLNDCSCENEPSERGEVYRVLGISQDKV